MKKTYLNDQQYSDRLDAVRKGLEGKLKSGFFDNRPKLMGQDNQLVESGSRSEDVKALLTAIDTAHATFADLPKAAQKELDMQNTKRVFLSCCLAIQHSRTPNTQKARKHVEAESAHFVKAVAPPSKGIVALYDTLAKKFFCNDPLFTCYVKSRELLADQGKSDSLFLLQKSEDHFLRKNAKVCTSMKDAVISGKNGAFHQAQDELTASGQKFAGHIIKALTPLTKKAPPEVQGKARDLISRLKKSVLPAPNR